MSVPPVTPKNPQNSSLFSRLVKLVLSMPTFVIVTTILALGGAFFFGILSNLPKPITGGQKEKGTIAPLKQKGDKDDINSSGQVKLVFMCPDYCTKQRYVTYFPRYTVMARTFVPWQALPADCQIDVSDEHKIAIIHQNGLGIIVGNRVDKVIMVQAADERILERWIHGSITSDMLSFFRVVKINDPEQIVNVPFFARNSDQQNDKDAAENLHLSLRFVLGYWGVNFKDHKEGGGIDYQGYSDENEQSITVWLPHCYEGYKTHRLSDPPRNWVSVSDRIVYEMN